MSFTCPGYLREFRAFFSWQSLRRQSKGPVSVLSFSPTSGCNYLAIGDQDGCLDIYEFQGWTEGVKAASYTVVLEEHCPSRVGDGAHESESGTSEQGPISVVSLDWSLVSTLLRFSPMTMPLIMMVNVGLTK
jgi:hypothetical protein